MGKRFTDLGVALKKSIFRQVRNMPVGMAAVLLSAVFTTLDLIIMRNSLDRVDARRKVTA